MKYLLLVLSLAAVAQTEPPRHDKYREDPRAYCFHGAPDAAMPGNPSAHPCECHLMCVTSSDGSRTQGEQASCELYCTVARCLCHADEACDLPEIKK